MSDGDYSAWAAADDSEVPCRKCKVVGQIEWREWDSSCGGFEDYQYRCKSCGGSWWIEGPDA